MFEMLSELFDILEAYVRNEDERRAVYVAILPSLLDTDPTVVTRLALENEMFQEVYEEYVREKDEYWDD